MVEEVKKPWGRKKAKIQPRRTPMSTAAAIRDPAADWDLSLVSKASLRPAMVMICTARWSREVKWSSTGSMANGEKQRRGIHYTTQ